MTLAYVDPNSGNATLELVLILVLASIAVGIFMVVHRIRSRRPCGRCGVRFKRGELTCPSCGYDQRQTPAP